MYVHVHVHLHVHVCHLDADHRQVEREPYYHILHHACAHAQTHICIYAYMHTHTHTHMHGACLDADQGQVERGVAAAELVGAADESLDLLERFRAKLALVLRARRALQL